ncbi:hypothetical protein BC828DRAFT_372302 [Blastocladiella britannica]|nr:hypothetical protein BC828DRAFT_372302 [Blastocladiella britannica]
MQQQQKKSSAHELSVRTTAGIERTAELDTPSTAGIHGISSIPLTTGIDGSAGPYAKLLEPASQGHVPSLAPLRFRATSRPPLAGTARSQSPKAPGWLAHLRLAASQAWREAVRNKGQYTLGFGVVFISVVVTALLMAVTAYTNVIFLGLAQFLAGEIDFTINAADIVSTGRLNYSRIAEILPSPLDSGTTDPSYLHAPRFPDLGAVLFDPATCRGWNATQPAEHTFPYTGMPHNSSAPADVQSEITATRSLCTSTSGCLDALCSLAPFKTRLQLIDSAREKAAQIGSLWPYSDPIPKGKVVLQQDIADNMKISPGSWVIVRVSFTDIANYQLSLASQRFYELRGYNITIPSYAKAWMSIPMQVHGIVPDAAGKFSQTTQSLSFVEYGSILDLAATHLHPWFGRTLSDAFANVNNTVYHQVPQVLFTRQTPRFLSYSAPDYDTIAKSFLKWASDIRYRIGFLTTSIDTPVLNNLDDFAQLTQFVGLLMSLIIIVLSGLSAFLIYCLLMVSVESKTFELAILRMVGMQRETVLLLILMQALSYSIPALVLGCGVSQLGFVLSKKYLETFLNITIAPILPGSSWAVSVSMALVVPVISSILPIKRALGMNLHDSLDRYRPVIKAMTVTIERSMATFDPMLGALGMILTVIGFGIYYFMPLALLTNNLGLLFNIFLVILLGLISGLVFLATNFLQLLETIFRFIIFGTLFMENRSLPTLVERNLLSHRSRNRKTSMLYALSLAFVIFLSVTGNIEISSLMYSNASGMAGCHFVIFSDYVDSGKSPMGVRAITQLERYAQNNPTVIAGTAATSWPLGSISPRSLSAQISNLGRLDVRNAQVYGVSPGYLELADNQYLLVDAWDPKAPAYSPSEQLYSAKGTFSAVTGTYYQDQYSLYMYDQPFLVSSRASGAQGSVTRLSWPLWPMFFAKASPGYTMSSYPGKSQAVLVSLPTFLNMTGGAYSSVTTMPYRVFYVRLRPNVSTSEYNRVKRELRSLLSYEDMHDINQEQRGALQASSALNLIFQVVTALVMVITFFSLNTSFYVNITEQSKEIGILRALGVPRFAILRLYFYEALILVLASVVLGCGVGTIIGWTMAAQRSVLTETPISMIFPTNQVIVIAILSVASAIFSTIGPVYLVVFSRPLVRVLKE